MALEIGPKHIAEFITKYILIKYKVSACIIYIIIIIIILAYIQHKGDVSLEKYILLTTYNIYIYIYM
jgi:hypothetical protein